MLTLLQKMRTKLLIQALGVWKPWTKQRTAYLQQRGGVLLVRTGRGFLARARVRRLRQEIADAHALAKRLQKVQGMNTHGCATLIQSSMRSLLARKSFYGLLKRHRSSARLARSLRAFALLHSAKKKVTRKRREWAATRLLQRFMRGFFARLRVWHIRTNLSRAAFQARLADSEDPFRFYFEQNGSALKIQVWCKTLRWKAQIRRKRRREEASALIQRVGRGSLGRRIAREKRAQQDAKERRFWRGIHAGQALARRFLVRCRLPLRLRRRFRVGIHRRLPQSDTCRRRAVISFPNIIIGNISRKARLKKLHKSASLIQLQWRTFCARKWRKSEWVIWKDICVRRIQNWLRCWQWRRLRGRAQKIHHHLWQRRQDFFLRKVKASVWIQRTYRAILLRRKKGNPNRIRRLQLWWRGMYNIKRRKLMKAQRRCAFEQKAGGAQLFLRTIFCVQVETRWAGIQVKGFASEVKHEVHRIFSYNSPQGQIEASKVLKMMKECPGLLGKETGLDASKMDLVFAKVKAGNEKKLDFPRFIQFLFVVGALCYRVNHKDVPTSLLSQKSGKSKKSKNQKKAPASKSGEIIVWKEASDFSYGRMLGRPAVVCRFVDDFLVHINDYKRAVKELRAFSNDGRTDKKIHETVTRVQRWLMRRRSIIRRNRFINAVLAALRYKKEHQAASIINGMIRGFLNKLFLVKMAQRMYVKYCDTDQNPPREYWFNPRTGQVPIDVFFLPPFLKPFPSVCLSHINSPSNFSNHDWYLNILSPPHAGHVGETGAAQE